MLGVHYMTTFILVWVRIHSWTPTRSTRSLPYVSRCRALPHETFNSFRARCTGDRVINTKGFFADYKAARAYRHLVLIEMFGRWEAARIAAELEEKGR